MLDCLVLLLNVAPRNGVELIPADRLPRRIDVEDTKRPRALSKALAKAPAKGQWLRLIGLGGALARLPQRREEEERLAREEFEDKGFVGNLERLLLAGRRK